MVKDETHAKNKPDEMNAETLCDHHKKTDKRSKHRLTFTKDEARIPKQ